MPRPTVIATRLVRRRLENSSIGQGGGAAVVGDLDGHAVARSQDLAEGQVLPVEVDRRADRAGRRVDDARRPDADPEEGLAGVPRQLLDQLVDDLERFVAGQAGHGPLDGPLDLAAQVDECRPEHELAEIDPDDVPGAVDELEEDRCLAAGRRSPPDLAREAIAHQVADHVADRGPGEPAESRDLGATDRPEVVQRAQDEGRVVRPGLLVRGLGRKRQRRVRRSSPVAAPAASSPGSVRLLWAPRRRPPELCPTT